MSEKKRKRYRKKRKSAPSGEGKTTKPMNKRKSKSAKPALSRTYSSLFINSSPLEKEETKDEHIIKNEVNIRSLEKDDRYKIPYSVWKERYYGDLRVLVDLFTEEATRNGVHVPNMNDEIFNVFTSFVYDTSLADRI